MIKESDNKPFWSHMAAHYDFIMKKDAKSYQVMYHIMSEDLRPDMNVLELATGTSIIFYAI